MVNEWSYSSVPNNQAGSNKQAGWNLNELYIIEQALIIKQAGNFMKSNNQAGLRFLNW